VGNDFEEKWTAQEQIIAWDKVPLGSGGDKDQVMGRW
jgi:hypothetical protein